MIRLVESHRLGYPQLAAFLTLDEYFTIVKRFDFLHMRSIVEQQDRLAELEARLHQCDDEEGIQLNLSSRRQDGNNKRRELMKEVQETLKQYDDSVTRFSELLRLPQAKEDHKRSVHCWMQGNKPLVRSESIVYDKILEDNDFIALAWKANDRTSLEDMVERLVRAFPNLVKRFRINKDKTQNKSIVLLPSSFVSNIVRLFLTVFTPLWLILPTLLLYNIQSRTGRACIFVLFTIWTSFIVVVTTNTTKSDLVLALVTYTAMLGAFIASE
ncbi:unnamed protein product [Fusarium graminearum]|nr:unnamed protein product [Fusarium graminearum]